MFKQSLMFAIAAFLSVTACCLLNYYGYNTELPVAAGIIAIILVVITGALASLVGGRAATFMVSATFAAAIAAMILATAAFPAFVFTDVVLAGLAAGFMMVAVFNSIERHNALSFWKLFIFWLISIAFLAGSIFMVIEDLPGCLFVAAGATLLPLLISGADLIFQATGDFSLFRKKTIVNY